MGKKFNVTGICVPERHYMVDISKKLEQIRVLVDAGEYFTINRGRQYGKTTTLFQLKKYIGDYLVISISFEGIGDVKSQTESAFCETFIERVARALRFTKAYKSYRESWNNSEVKSFAKLSEHITDRCEGQQIVLMIDEVDKLLNNLVFVNFLGMLREKYLAAATQEDFTFHSVILAGVYDIRNMKWKIKEAHGESATKTNSPWNIAAKFNVDMSFNPDEISTMLMDYEKDYKTGMDIGDISKEIHAYTSGYPFLVSRICQCIHEELEQDWSKEGIQKAIKIIFTEGNTLFDDLSNNLNNRESLTSLIKRLVIDGEKFNFNLANEDINLGVRYGYFQNKENALAISNKMFEIFMTTYFIDDMKIKRETLELPGARAEIIQDGKFDMALCLEKFAEHYGELYDPKRAEFLERNGTLLFLTYMVPIINGKGFYYVENQTLNELRMDLVINYGGEEFVIELKKWRGEKAHGQAYQQLATYLNHRNLDTGYLLTYDFRQKKGPKVEWNQYEDKRIMDVIV